MLVEGYQMRNSTACGLIRIGNSKMVLVSCAKAPNSLFTVVNMQRSNKLFIS